MSSKRGRGRPRKQFIDEEPEEVNTYTNEDLEGLETEDMEALEEEEAPRKPATKKRAAETPLQKPTTKASKVQAKPNAPATKAAVKPSMPKPKPKPKATIGKGKEKEAAPVHNRTKARGLVNWIYDDDRSVANIDLDDYEDILERLYVNRRGKSGWNFEVGYYVETDEEWLAAGAQLPRDVRPIRICLSKPHRMHFVPSRFGDGQWGGVKLPESELKKKPYSVSLELDLDNEKDDFDRKLTTFYEDFRRKVGELIISKVGVDEVRLFFELPPADNCDFWFANAFLDDKFFKGMFTISESGRGSMKVKFPLSFTGDKLYRLGDLSLITAPRELPGPELIEADEGLLGTLEFGDIWVARLKATKPDPDTGLFEEYFSSGQTANAAIVWRMTRTQTEDIIGPPPSGGQDKLKLQASESVDMSNCGFLVNLAKEHELED